MSTARIATDTVTLEPAIQAFADRHGQASPATWNRELATLRSASACGAATAGLLATRPTSLNGAGDDRPDPSAHRRSGRGAAVRRELALRERTLWRLQATSLASGRRPSYAFVYASWTANASASSGLSSYEKPALAKPTPYAQANASSNPNLRY
jgi:hypothetical protein